MKEVVGWKEIAQVFAPILDSVFTFCSWTETTPGDRAKEVTRQQKIHSLLCEEEQMAPSARRNTSALPADLHIHVQIHAGDSGSPSRAVGKQNLKVLTISSVKCHQITSHEEKGTFQAKYFQQRYVLQELPVLIPRSEHLPPFWDAVGNGGHQVLPARLHSRILSIRTIPVQLVPQHHP